MIKIFIDESPIFVPENTSVLEACSILGIFIPRFCYHERLNVAGNCRFCLLEIDEADRGNSGKPIASCAVPVSNNLEIFTKSPMIQKARENVLEFLLMNHPLDCPICDQGGECDLQEQTILFGADRTRFAFNKRTIELKEFGPFIKTIMNRCISCTRCVRFFEEIAGTEDFGSNARGLKTEISSYIHSSIKSELSANAIDLCPVGALTSKPFAFTNRSWKAKNIKGIDLLDAIGSNIKIEYKGRKILRITPFTNDTLNEEWITDKSRFFFDSLNTFRLAETCLVKTKNKFSKVTLKKVVKIINSKFDTLSNSNTEKIVMFCGNFIDYSAVSTIKEIAFSKNLPLISEEFANVDNDLLDVLKFNLTFSEILNSDFCMHLGSNVRFEGSLLNVRLKKKHNLGDFASVSLGLTENLLYTNKTLGSNLKTLVEIIEGKAFLCNALLKFKKPIIILGLSLLKRKDSNANFSLLADLQKRVKLTSEDWFGLNHLPLRAGDVSQSVLNAKRNNRQLLTEKKIAIFFEVDNYKNIFSQINKKCFSIAENSLFDPLIEKTNCIIPSTTFFEKNQTFLNLEGRLQKIESIFLKNNFSIVDILVADKSPKKESINLLHFKENRENFIKKLFKDRCKKNGINKISKTFFKVPFTNFFKTNNFEKNSKVLERSSKLFASRYENFI